MHYEKTVNRKSADLYHMQMTSILMSLS